MTGRETFREFAAVRLGAARDVGTVPLDDERELHLGSSDRRRISRRSRAVSSASSCTHANSTWLVRRWRSKLSRLYSYNQRKTGMRMWRLRKNQHRGRTSGAMRLVAHRCGEPPGIGFAEQFGEDELGGVRCAGRRVQQRFDVGKERGVLEIGRAAAGQHLRAQPFAHTAVQARSSPRQRRRAPHRPKPSPTPPRTWTLVLTAATCFVFCFSLKTTLNWPCCRKT